MMRAAARGAALAERVARAGPILATGEEVKLWLCSDSTKGHIAGVFSIVVVNDKVVSGGGDGAVIVWDLTLNHLQSFTGHQGSVNALAALSPVRAYAEFQKQF